MKGIWFRSRVTTFTPMVTWRTSLASVALFKMSVAGAVVAAARRLSRGGRSPSKLLSAAWGACARPSEEVAGKVRVELEVTGEVGVAS